MIRKTSLTLVRAADVATADTVKFTDRLHYVHEFGRDRLDPSKLVTLEITTALYETWDSRLELLIRHLAGELPVLVVSEEFQNDDGSVNEAAFLRYLSEGDASAPRWTIGQPSAGGPPSPLAPVVLSGGSVLMPDGAFVPFRDLGSTSLFTR